MLGTKKPKTHLLQAPKQETQKAVSLKHEKRLEKELKARRQPASGALPFLSLKGDLVDATIVWQAKTTKGKSFTLNQKILIEVVRQASLQGKSPGVVVTMEGLSDPVPKDWVIIPLSLWKEVVDG